MSESQYYVCGEVQTVNHIVDTYPRTNFNGDMEKLEAELGVI